MPSPEVIDLTLSDDETQPDPIRSDQGPPTPTQATNRFRTSSSTPPTSGINRTRRILPVNQGTFAAIERAENYLPLQPFFNNTHFGQTLINCIHNQHRIGIPDEYFVETCINTYTQNGFVTKEFVKIDEASRTLSMSPPDMEQLHTPRITSKSTLSLAILFSTSPDTVKLLQKTPSSLTLLLLMMVQPWPNSSVAMILWSVMPRFPDPGLHHHLHQIPGSDSSLLHSHPRHL